MKNLLRILLALGATTVAAFAQTGTAIPGGNQSAPYVIAKPGRYYLAADRVMTNSNLNAIEISSPDVTLDLNGYAVKFASTTGTGCGVAIPNAINVEIKNGSLTNIPDEVIHIDSTSGSDVRLIDLRIASSKGFSAGIPNVLVDRCHFSDIRGNAIRIVGTNAIVRNCQVTNVENGAGIIIGGRGLIANNNVSSVSYDGISVHVQNGQEEGALVVGNVVSYVGTAKGQFSAGISAGNSPASVFRDNVVTRAFGTGISGAVGSIVEGNTVSYTQPSKGSGVGTGISSTDGSTILRNNSGFFNAGGFISGPHTNAGGNVGS